MTTTLWEGVKEREREREGEKDNKKKMEKLVKVGVNFSSALLTDQQPIC